MYAAIHYLKCALNLLSFQVREAEQTVTAMFSTGIIFLKLSSLSYDKTYNFTNMIPVENTPTSTARRQKVRENGDTTINIKIITEIINEISLSK